MNFYKKNKAAFTLVELLVVISIIALLLALLMPALNKAREQGRKVQCAAQEKSMGIAMQMYATGNNDTYPGLIMIGKLSDLYLYNKQRSFWHQVVMKYAGNNKLLRCASLNTKKLMQWNDTTYLTGFGLNYNGWTMKATSEWIKGDDPDGAFGYVIPEEPRGGCIKTTRVRRPGAFIMLGDSNGNKQTDAVTLRSNYKYGILGPPRELGSVNPRGDMPDVHAGGGNIVFADCHIKWYKASDLLSDGMLQMWSRGK
jgi:prepilin-type N-terminal cleavage/methylation domain-containing protein/prepilin-type processing-associated H-X9-DG protein